MRLGSDDGSFPWRLFERCTFFPEPTARTVRFCSSRLRFALNKSNRCNWPNRAFQREVGPPQVLMNAGDHLKPHLAVGRRDSVSGMDACDRHAARSMATLKQETRQWCVPHTQLIACAGASEPTARLTPKPGPLREPSNCRAALQLWQCEGIPLMR